MPPEGVKASSWSCWCVHTLALLCFGTKGLVGCRTEAEVLCLSLLVCGGYIFPSIAVDNSYIKHKISVHVLGVFFILPLLLRSKTKEKWVIS